MMIKNMYRLFRKKYFLFLLLVVFSFSIIGELYHFLILSNITSITISLNYPGAESGLNPDGSRFNISEMTSGEMLNRAKAGLNMEKIPNDEIKKRLFITTKFSQKAMENVVSDIRDGLQSSYVPTTYYIYYSQKNKFAKNETHEFLQALAKNYEQYFTEKRAENNTILKYTPESYDFTEYDYSEIYTILYNKADEMLTLITTHREENRGFRSEDNLNFDTVKDELSNFKNVKLEKFNAYVIQNNISKNRPVYLNKLDYLKDSNLLSYNKYMQASDIAKNALLKYDPQITAVAFVPSVDNTNSYYMSKTKTGIDDLANRSYSDGMEAARISKKLDDYSNRYAKLSGAADTAEQAISYTDAYLSGILKDLESISEKIVKLDNEYLAYKTENYFKCKIPEKGSVISFSTMIRFAVLGFIFALLIILYMEFMHGVVADKTKSVRNTFAVLRKLRR